MAASKSRSGGRKGTAGRGGPATYAGANFQTLIGVHEIVGLLGSLAVHPWQTSTISAEPRSFGSSGQVAYDIGLPESNRRLEVKRAPTRADIREFLEAVADDPDSHDGRTTFEFVHGQASKAVADLTEILRTASEAVNAAHFSDLVSRMPDDQRQLVAHLGPEPSIRARQIRTFYISEADARQRIEWTTNRMYGEGPAQAVRDRLAARFAAAAETRESFQVGDLRDELAAIGGQSQFAPAADLTGLPTLLQDALTILTSLDVPIPLFILSAALGVAEAELAKDLEPFVSCDTLHMQPAVQLTASLGPLTHRRRADLLSSALGQLLTLAEDRTRRTLAISQVRNIACLAETLLDTNPQLVSRAYPVAEKLFKTTGNLQLALTTARLSLRASERHPTSTSRVTDQQLRDRAQTLICGESWVLQRIGDLDEADRIALESQGLGERLGWTRNTAYCLKCRGRLQRMRAELEAGEDRIRLLDESEKQLRDAIEEFSSAQEFGPDHAEVGDCHSLLARTLFVGGRYQAAWRELRTALNLLERERGTKDWADALILEAELTARDGEVGGAIAILDDVFREFPASVDSDATEITARALAVRGHIRGRRDPDGAGEDHGRAADLYECLDDHQRSDEQTWARLVITGSVPTELRLALEAESIPVRVAAVANFQREFAESSTRAAGQRRGISQAHLRQIITDARLDAERRGLRWR